MRQFRTLYGKPIPNIIEYIKEYISTKKNVEILIGSDSQCYGNNKTIYGVAIALYTPGKGAHVLCTRESLPMEFSTPTRLLNEVWKSIEIAEWLRENDIPRAKWIDLDLNPNPKYKSYGVFKQAVGLVEGMGYNVRYKHFGAMAISAANHLVRI
jgi:predicted RNase H-related nuclease YkuK (DUF458 family)